MIELFISLEFVESISIFHVTSHWWDDLCHMCSACGETWAENIILFSLTFVFHQLTNAMKIQKFSSNLKHLTSKWWQIRGKFLIRSCNLKGKMSQRTVYGESPGLSVILLLSYDDEKILIFMAISHSKTNKNFSFILHSENWQILNRLGWVFSSRVRANIISRLVEKGKAGR